MGNILATDRFKGLCSALIHSWESRPRRSDRAVRNMVRAVIDDPGKDSYDGDGGAGDRLDLRFAPTGVSVDLRSGRVADRSRVVTNTFSGIEQVRGSGFGDVLTGTSADDVLLGSGGNDLLNGLNGDDILNLLHIWTC